MIFAIMMIVLVLAIAFFHYLQGLLSATLSAIIAVIAAALAVSYHEPIVAMLSRGKFNDQAYAISLIVLFAAIYLLLRVLFDSMVPGNVRLPAIMDKVGGAAMGLIAGIFATGIVALAGQTLPFGPSIAGYTRYETVDERNVSIPSGVRTRQSMDALVYHEMVDDTFDPTREQGLVLPVDDMMLAMVSHLSDGGSLAGARSLGSVHPDYPQELFGNRLGIQVGAKHTAQSIAEVAGIFTVDSLNQIPAELPSVQSREIPPTLKPVDDEMILVVRALFHKDASDKDWMFRFSPGSVRLVASGVNYYPVGTLDGGSALKANRVDDFLLVDLKEADKGADLVFVVNKMDVLAGEGTENTIADGVFLEVKRLAREDLSAKPVVKGITADERIDVLRKGPLQVKPRPQRQRPAAPGAPGAPAGGPPGPAMDANGLPSAR